MKKQLDPTQQRDSYEKINKEAAKKSISLIGVFANYPQKLKKLFQQMGNSSEKNLVKKNRKIIKTLKNPSKTVQLEAVWENWRAIQYIENPSEKVQFAAVLQNKNALQYIENPSEEVLDLVKKKKGTTMKE